MTRLLHPLVWQLLILLLIAESLVIVAGRLIVLDVIRPSFLAYAEYLPGEMRPMTGCVDTWDYWTTSYGDFACVFHELDEVNVYGNGTVITGASIEFANARVGDVMALLGKPEPRRAWMSKRSLARYYELDGIQVYLHRSQQNLFERVRFLWFWKPLPL